MNTETRAMVIGANGQDGSFLVSHLLEKKYQVLGVGRQPHSRMELNTSSYTYHQVNLETDGELSHALEAFKPHLIFHVAATHTSAGGIYEPIFGSVLKVNVASVYAILEYQRVHPGSRLCYASSAKVFGSPLPDSINENTPIKNDCLYSVSKNTAYHLIDYYRKRHGVIASVLYLFNHESELRPDSFFIPKVLQALVDSVNDRDHVTEVYTLDFLCDWGSAEEYMDLMIDILEKTVSEDFVLAKGECINARVLVANLFAEYGLDYSRHFRELMTSSNELRAYKVELEKLNTKIGRVPIVSIDEVCRNILRKKYFLEMVCK